MESSKLSILYEDNHVVAVYKPHGILVQGDKTQDISLLSLTKDWIRWKKNKPGNVFLGLVHRLDRPVAGVVIFGKTSKGASRLSEQFRNRSVRKVYHAIVEGRMKSPSGSLIHCLDSDDTHSWVSADGRKCELHYRVLKQGNDRTWLEVELTTGRKHQIRTQFSAEGNPIVGDAKYGAKLLFKEGGIALLAYSIEFDQPTGGQRVTVNVPPDLVTVAL